MKAPLLDLYQQQELKMLEHEMVLAKEFLAANRDKFDVKAICLVIGQSRAGKSTLLAKSGLNLVDAAFNALQASANKITTTKSCTFWFDQNTIFIDTAGVYTKPDLSSEASSALWLSFIKLLKQHFKKVPICDIIAVLDLPSLLDTELLNQNLDHLRMRIYEVSSLVKKLQLHVLITKVDLILGFNDYFANLTDEYRLSPMGVIFNQQNQNGLILEFEQKFNKLLRQLNDRLLDLLHTNADLNDPVLVKAFPSELAQLYHPIETVLSKIPYGASITLKEVLLVSSCQHGKVLDPIKLMMSSGFSARSQSSYALEYFGQRSYFIQGFFKHLNQQYTESRINNLLVRNLLTCIVIILTLGAFKWLSMNYNWQCQLLALDKSLIAKAFADSSVKLSFIKRPWWVFYRIDRGIISSYTKKSDFKLVAKLIKQLETYLNQLMKSPSKLETNLMILDAYKAYLIATDKGASSSDFKWLSNYLAHNAFINSRFNGKERTRLFNIFSAAHSLKGTSYLRHKALENSVNSYLKKLSQVERLALLALSQQVISHKDLIKLASYMDSTLVRDAYLNKLNKALNLRLASPNRLVNLLMPIKLNKALMQNLMGYLLGFLSGGSYALTPDTISAKTQLNNWHSSFHAWLKQRANPSNKISKRQRILLQAIIEQWEEDYQRLVKDPKLYRESLSIYLKKVHEGELDGVILPFSSMLENWITKYQPASLRIYEVWQNSFWQIIARITKEEMVKEWNQKIVPFFQHKLAAFYPLQIDSHREVKLEDFQHLFGPKGLIAGFSKEWVEPFIYNNGDDPLPTWFSLNDRETLFSLAILEAVTRAKLITKAFYGSEKNDLMIEFTLLAQNRAKQLELKLDIDGQKASIFDAAPQKLVWPGPKSGSVVINGRSENGGHLMQSFLGSWALFRALEKQAELTWRQDQMADMKVSLLDPSTGRTYVWRFTLHDLNPFNPLSLKLLRRIFLEPVE